MSNSFDIAISRNFMLRSFYFDIPWPTKYTAIYATFEGQKTWCYEFMNFPLILAVKFSKKKEL